MSVVYGPGKEMPAAGEATIFVPAPFRGRAMTEDGVAELRRSGLAFLEGELEKVADFVNDGIVSTNRYVIVLFCDLKGSTLAGRVLGREFRNVQSQFLDACVTAVEELGTSQSEGAPRFVVDKFMGDGVMVYVDCGQATAPGTEGAAIAVLVLIRKLVDAVAAISNGPIADILRGQQVKLGLRFGIAAGSGVTLSVLGGPHGDFTVTGEVVNLAARLEHATPSQFLASLDEEATRLEQFRSRISREERLVGTALGEALDKRDREIVDLFEVCRQDFEIRADTNFRRLLEVRDKAQAVRLAWREVSFSPRGFSMNRTVHLLGGNSSAELLRVV